MRSVGGKKKAIKVKAEIKAPFISMVISEMSNEEHMFHTRSGIKVPRVTLSAEAENM